MTQIVCPKCAGDGWVEQEESVPSYSNGSGHIVSKRIDCFLCDGFGAVEVEGDDDA